MRFTIAASAVFAGLAVAMPAVTLTEQSTEIDTITSCGPEVTNCPARSTSAPAVQTSSAPAETPAQVSSTPSSTEVAPVASSSAAFSSIPGIPGGCNPAHPGSCPDSYFSTSVPAAPATTEAPPAPQGPVTVTKQSTEVDTITSCGPEVTNCPARSSSTAVAPQSSPVSPVASAPYPVGNNGTNPAAPSGTGSGSPSASFSGPPSAFTGAASMNTVSGLGLVGALAAFLL